MGKKQHQSDKLYLTTAEWKHIYGGHKEAPPGQSGRANFRRLPFDHCSLSLQPFDVPYCTEDGSVFSLTHIVPFLKKYGQHPITGETLDAKSLIKLIFHKNAAGEFHCPVTFKVFTENTHIVAIKQTGNVYAYEAIEELNIKPKHFKDLLTDEPFARKDIIHLQDPGNLEKLNIAKFFHVKNKLSIVDEEEEKRAKSDPQYTLKFINSETKQTLAELGRDYKPAEATASTSKKADLVNAAHYSTGMVAAGFTSTVMEPVTVHEPAIRNEDDLRYERSKKKGYVRLVTNLGAINLELHCEYVPKTCENFIRHCKSGYYNGSIFHRSIKHFMIQGGDPTGTGTGGDSCWGGPFKDEFMTNLQHTGRGILSMANSGPNTNKSQFFITYRSCQHLDKKHSVFGRVVGGMETLNAMERIETDKKDKPKVEIKILDCQVFVDPFEEADELLRKERSDSSAASSESQTDRKSNFRQNDTAAELKVYSSGVGKYIQPTKAPTSSSSDAEEPSKKKKKVIASGFNNFSNW